MNEPLGTLARPECTLFRPLADPRDSGLHFGPEDTYWSYRNFISENSKTAHARYLDKFTGTFPNPAVKSPDLTKLTTQDLLGMSLYLHRTIQNRNYIKARTDSDTKVYGHRPWVFTKDESMPFATTVNKALFKANPALEKLKNDIDTLLLKRRTETTSSDMKGTTPSPIPPMKDGKVDWTHIWYDQDLIESALKAGDNGAGDFSGLFSQPLKSWGASAKTQVPKASFLQTLLLPSYALLKAEVDSEAAFPKSALPNAKARAELLAKEAAKICKDKYEPDDDSFDLDEQYRSEGPIANIGRYNQYLYKNPSAPKHFRGLPVALRYHLLLNPQLAQKLWAADSDVKTIFPKLSALEALDPAGKLSDEHFKKSTEKELAQHLKDDEFLIKAKVGLGEKTERYFICKNDRDCKNLVSFAKADAESVFLYGFSRWAAIRGLGTLEWPKDQKAIEAVFTLLNHHEKWTDSKGNPVTPKLLFKELRDSGMEYDPNWEERAKDEVTVPALHHYRWITELYKTHPGKLFDGRGKTYLEQNENQQKAVSDMLFLLALETDPAAPLQTTEFRASAQKILDAHFASSYTPPPDPKLKLGDDALEEAARKHAGDFDDYVLKEIRKLGDSSDDYTTKTALTFLLHRINPKFKEHNLDKAPFSEDVAKISEIAKKRFPSERLPKIGDLIRSFHFEKIKLTPEEGKILEAMGDAAFDGTAELSHFLLEEGPEFLTRLSITPEGPKLLAQPKAGLAKDDSAIVPLRFAPVPPERKAKKADDPENRIRASVLKVNADLALRALKSVVAKEKGWSDTRENLFARLNELSKGIWRWRLQDYYCTKGRPCDEAGLKSAPSQLELSSAIRLLNLHLMGFRNGDPIEAQEFPTGAAGDDAFRLSRAELSGKERSWLLKEAKALKDGSYWGHVSKGDPAPKDLNDLFLNPIFQKAGTDVKAMAAVKETKDSLIVPILRDILHEKDFVQHSLAKTKTREVIQALKQMDIIVDDTLANLGELFSFAAPGGGDLSKIGNPKTATIGIKDGGYYYYWLANEGSGLIQRSRFGTEHRADLEGIPLSLLNGGNPDDLLLELNKQKRLAGKAVNIEGFDPRIEGGVPTPFVGNWVPPSHRGKTLTPRSWGEFVNFHRKLEAFISQYGGIHKVEPKYEAAVKNHLKYAQELFGLEKNNWKLPIEINGTPDYLSRLAYGFQTGSHGKAELDLYKERSPELYSQLVTYFQLFPKEHPVRKMVLEHRFPPSVLYCDNQEVTRGPVPKRLIALFDEAPRSVVALEWVRNDVGNPGSCAELRKRLERGLTDFFGKDVAGKEDTEIKIATVNPYSNLDYDISKQWMSQAQAKYIHAFGNKNLTYQEKEELARVRLDLSEILNMSNKLGAPIAGEIFAKYPYVSGGPYAWKSDAGLIKIGGAGSGTTSHLTFLRHQFMAQLAIVRSCLKNDPGCSAIADVAQLKHTVDLTKLSDPANRETAEWVAKGLQNASLQLDQLLLEQSGKGKTQVTVDDLNSELGSITTALKNLPALKEQYRKSRFSELAGQAGYVSRGLYSKESAYHSNWHWPADKNGWVNWKTSASPTRAGPTEFQVKINEHRTPLSDLITNHSSARFTFPKSSDATPRIDEYLDAHPATDLQAFAGTYSNVGQQYYAISTAKLARLQKQPTFLVGALRQIQRKGGYGAEQLESIFQLPTAGPVMSALMKNHTLKAAYSTEINSALVGRFNELSAKKRSPGEDEERVMLFGMISPGKRNVDTVLRVASSTALFSMKDREQIRNRVYEDLTKHLVRKGHDLGKISKMSQPEITKAAQASLDKLSSTEAISKFFEHGTSLDELAKARGSDVTTESLLFLISALEDAGDNETGFETILVEQQKGGILRWDPQFRLWAHEKEKAAMKSHFTPTEKDKEAPAKRQVAEDSDWSETVKAKMPLLKAELAKSGVTLGAPKGSLFSSLTEGTKLKEAFSEKMDDFIRVRRLALKKELQGVTNEAFKNQKRSQSVILTNLNYGLYEEVLEVLPHVAPAANAKREAASGKLLTELVRAMNARGYAWPSGDPASRVVIAKAHAQKSTTKALQDERTLHFQSAHLGGLESFAKARNTTPEEEMVLMLLGGLQHADLHDLVDQLEDTADLDFGPLNDKQKIAGVAVGQAEISDFLAKRAGTLGPLQHNLLPKLLSQRKTLRRLQGNLSNGIDRENDRLKTLLKTQTAPEKDKTSRLLSILAQFDSKDFVSDDVFETAPIVTPEAHGDRRAYRGKLESWLAHALDARGFDLKALSPDRLTAVKQYIALNQGKLSDQRTLFAGSYSSIGLGKFAELRGTSFTEEAILHLLDVIDDPEGRVLSAALSKSKGPETDLQPKTVQGKGLHQWLNKLAEHGVNLSPLQRVQLLEKYSEATDKQLKHLEPLLTKARAGDDPTSGRRELIGLLKAFDPAVIEETLVVTDQNSGLIVGPSAKTRHENRAEIMRQLLKDGKLDEKGKQSLLDWAQDEFVNHKLPELTALFLNPESKENVPKINAALKQLAGSDIAARERDLRNDALAAIVKDYQAKQITGGADPKELYKELMLIAHSFDFEPNAQEAAARKKHADLVTRTRSLYDSCVFCAKDSAANNLRSSMATAVAMTKLDGHKAGADLKVPDKDAGKDAAPSIAWQNFQKVAEGACSSWETRLKELESGTDKTRGELEEKEKGWIKQIFDASKNKKTIEVAIKDALIERNTLRTKIESINRSLGSLNTLKLNGRENKKQEDDLKLSLKTANKQLKSAEGALNLAKINFDQFTRDFRTILERIEVERGALSEKLSNQLLQKADGKDKIIFSAERLKHYQKAAETLIPSSLRKEALDSGPLLDMAGRKIASFCQLKEEARRVGAAIGKVQHPGDFRTHSLYQSVFAPDIIASYGLPVEHNAFDSVVADSLAMQNQLTKDRKTSHDQLKAWGIAWDGGQKFSHGNLKIQKKDRSSCLMDVSGKDGTCKELVKNNCYETETTWDDFAKTLDEFEKHLPLDPETSGLAKYGKRPTPGKLKESLKTQVIELWAGLGFPKRFEFGKTSVRVSGDYPKVSIVFEDLELVQKDGQALAAAIHKGTSELINAKLPKWSGAHNDIINRLNPWGSTEYADGPVKMALECVPSAIGLLGKEFDGIYIKSRVAGTGDLSGKFASQLYDMQHRHDTLFNVQQVAIQINDDIRSFHRQFLFNLGIMATYFIPGPGWITGTLGAARLGAGLHTLNSVIDSTVVPRFGGQGEFHWAQTERDLYTGTAGFALGHGIGAGLGTLLKVAPHGIGATVTQILGFTAGEFTTNNLADVFEGLPVDYSGNLLKAAKSGFTAAGFDQLAARRFAGFLQRAAVSFGTLHFVVTPLMLGFEEIHSAEKIEKQRDHIKSRLAELRKDPESATLNKAEIDRLMQEESNLGLWPKLKHAWTNPATVLTHLYFARMAGIHGRVLYLHDQLLRAGESGTNVDAILRSVGIDPTRVGHEGPRGSLLSRIGRGLINLAVGNPYEALHHTIGGFTIDNLRTLERRATEGPSSRVSEAKKAFELVSEQLGLLPNRLRQVLPELEKEFGKHLAIGDVNVAKKTTELVAARVREDLRGVREGQEVRRDGLLEELMAIDPNGYRELSLDVLDIENETHQRAIALAAEMNGENPELFQNFVALYRRDPGMTWDQLLAEYRRSNPTDLAGLIRLLRDGRLSADALASLFPDHAAEIRAEAPIAPSRAETLRSNELGTALQGAQGDGAPALSPSALAYLANNLYGMSPENRPAIQALLRRQFNRAPTRAEVEAVISWMRSNLTRWMPSLPSARPSGLTGETTRTQLSLFQGRALTDFLSRNTGGKAVALTREAVARMLGVTPEHARTVSDMVVVDRNGRLVVIDAQQTTSDRTSQSIDQSIARIQNTVNRLMSPSRSPQITASSVGGLEIVLPEGATMRGYGVNDAGYLTNAAGEPVTIRAFGLNRNIRVRYVN